jgi:hypothetical protein
MASTIGSTSDYIAREATAMKSTSAQQQIGAAVLRSIMDQQKTSGEALVKMIQQGAVNQFASTGHIDIRA